MKKLITLFILLFALTGAHAQEVSSADVSIHHSSFVEPFVWQQINTIRLVVVVASCCDDTAINMKGVILLPYQTTVLDFQGCTNPLPELPVNGRIECGMQNIGVNEIAEFSVVVTYPQQKGIPIIFTVFISSETSDPNQANNYRVFVLE